MSQNYDKLLTIVMDGVGERPLVFGNAVAAAHTPHLDLLKKTALYTTLKAHGTAVGLPSDGDMGNSEVGHNALGGGRIIDQGAKLVDQSLNSGALFDGKVWQELISSVNAHQASLHFIGLLSDGNVHSHEKHLYALLEKAKESQVKRARIHILFDGRDVPNLSAESYVSRLEEKIAALQSPQFDLKMASGGGRMVITMDRYEADWEMVHRGWETHVLGRGRSFFSAAEALETFRSEGFKDDQNLPAFVIKNTENKAVGTIENGDGVVFYNFRGDRAIEISRAFTEKSFDKFERERFPKVYFAGMMQYDGDLKIPTHYLVSPPQITGTLSENLIDHKVSLFACSETQKFGHVTYFWNGNRSGYLDKNFEEYLEIPSDRNSFDLKPWMKAEEITTATIDRMQKQSFQCGRINFPNGDMVGHTGDLDAAIIAVSIVDQAIGRLLQAAVTYGYAILITADHGNCDDMFEGGTAEKYPDWLSALPKSRPQGKTAHSLSAVPFYFFDPLGRYKLAPIIPGQISIAAVAATTLTFFGIPTPETYIPSLIQNMSTL